MFILGLMTSFILGIFSSSYFTTFFIFGDIIIDFFKFPFLFLSKLNLFLSYSNEITLTADLGPEPAVLVDSDCCIGRFLTLLVVIRYDS